MERRHAGLGSVQLVAPDLHMGSIFQVTLFI
jgi:hypothetical protein